jgi:hypothetical protein
MMIIYMRIYVQQPNLLTLLANSFSEDTEENRNMVLEILEVLPELMNDEKVVIEDEIRANFIQFAMKNLQPEILKTLSTACDLPQLPTRRRYQLINCFHSWMISETSEEVKQAIHQLSLLRFCYNELRMEQENNEEAADAIIACMVICKDANRYPDLYKSIIEGLFSGKAEFERFVAHGSEDEVQQYISVYSVLVSRIFDQILDNPNNEAIEFMLQGVFLKVMQQQKRDIVSKAVLAITSIVKKLSADEIASPDKQVKIRNFIELYYHWFVNIIECACNHCRLSEVPSIHPRSIWTFSNHATWIAILRKTSRTRKS